MKTNRCKEKWPHSDRPWFSYVCGCESRLDQPDCKHYRKRPDSEWCDWNWDRDGEFSDLCHCPAAKAEAKERRLAKKG